MMRGEERSDINDEIVQSDSSHSLIPSLGKLCLSLNIELDLLQFSDNFLPPLVSPYHERQKCHTGCPIKKVSQLLFDITFDNNQLITHFFLFQ